MKENSNRSVLTSGLWFTISNFTMKTIGFLTTPIFTRLMTKSEFGDFNNIQTWMMLLMYITSLNLEGSLIRASYEHKEDLDNYAFSMLGLSVTSTVIWLGLVCAFIDRFSLWMAINKSYIYWMFAYLLFMPLVNIFQNVERFRYNYKWTVYSSMFISIGASFLSVLFVFFFSNKLLGRVAGYILPVVILGLILIVYYLRKQVRIKLKYWKYALPIVLPYIPHLLSMYLLNSVDKVMIKNYCGSEILALYSLAYTCGMLITILVNSINSAFSPWLADKLSANEYEEIYKVSFPYVGFFCFISIGAALITPEILFILGGSSYMQAMYVLPPVAAGCLLQFVYCMYVNVEQYEKKTVGMAMASVVAAVVNYYLNMMFIPKYGYVAAAYTTYFGYLTLLLMHMYIVSKLKMLHIYSNKRIFVSTILTSIIIMMVSFILKATSTRYIALSIYLFVALCFIYRSRKQIKQLVKRVKK